MLPEEVYKRRHYDTPKSVIIIMANYIVVAFAIQVWAMCTKINWFFWVVLGIMAFYNFYSVRRYRDEYDRKQVIIYVASIVGLIALFFLFRLKAKNCGV